jgi:hypothetical protein
VKSRAAGVGKEFFLWQRKALACAWGLIASSDVSDEMKDMTKLGTTADSGLSIRCVDLSLT